MNLNNKKIIITGASSGIGEASALLCAEMGAQLLLFGRNEDRLQNLLKKLKGSNHEYKAFDLTESKELESAIIEAHNIMGAFDGLIHSAGIQKTMPLQMTNANIFHQQYQVNVIAGFDICRILQKKKLWNQQGASIVFIASIYGVTGVGAQLAYSASKGAVISGAKSLSIELATSYIRVNSISPGMVEGTQMTEGVIKRFSSEWEKQSKSEYPLGWVEPIDVANAAFFLLSDASRKITGTNMIVDGGFCAK